jgi:hypothetical protein
MPSMWKTSRYCTSQALHSLRHQVLSLTPVTGSEQHFLVSRTAPNKSLQRTVNHKVLGRGRVVAAPWQAPRARVLASQPAAAVLSR